ncbi:hypothetical protein HD806DRAFT_535422 [Xylariaceae sp. AK1471]|nr:hypothetical protein HD806DRAFT_535422 [Xylariaceae sp. AK1471]
MPGTVVPSGRDPSTTQNAAGASSSASEASKSDWRDIPKKKRHRQEVGFQGVQGNSKLKLAKPFSKKARRIITRKTEKLIERRNALDREVLRAVEKTNPNVNDWLPRDKLLRNRERLEKREQHHLRKRTKKLVELERLYRWDPSSDRAYDFDLVRKLLWRFKRNLGPLLDEYINRRKEKDHNKGDDDGTSSSNSDSEWSDISDDGDGETTGGKKSSLVRKKGAKKPTVHSQNKTTAKDSLKGVLVSTQMDGGKRKRDEDTESTPSKKVRFALDEDENQAPDVALGQDTNDKRLDLKDAAVPNKDEARGGSQSAEDESQYEKNRKLKEGRHRLDEIVKEGFRSIDAHVYDRWTPPLDSRREENVWPTRPYHMFGALVTDPSQLYSNLSTADITEDAEDIPNNPRLQTIGPCLAAQGPKTLMEVSKPLGPSFHEKVKSTSGAGNGSRVEYGPDPVNSDYDQFLPARDQVQSALSRRPSEVFQGEDPKDTLNDPRLQFLNQLPPDELKLLLDIHFPSFEYQMKSTNEMGSEDQKERFSPNRANSVNQQSQVVQSNQTHSTLPLFDTVFPSTQPRLRPETPIPAPQPWKQLGIESPFGDDLPRTPINRSHPSPSQTASTSQMRGQAPVPQTRDSEVLVDQLQRDDPPLEPGETAPERIIRVVAQRKKK